MRSRLDLTVVVTLAAGACPACDDDPQSHVYIAAPYVASEDCFGPSASLAQVDTPNGDLDCPPMCLLAPTSGGAKAVYVSTMCGPYPAGYDTSEADPLCATALAAWPAEAAALANGQSSCATPAGGDAGLADDAGDAGSVQDAATVGGGGQ